MTDTERDLDVPTWERRRGGTLQLEAIGQVGEPHERHPETPRLRWTNAPPREPGWFWNRPRGTTSGLPLYVFCHGGYLYVLDPGGVHRRDVRTMIGDEWSDQRIQEPIEP